MTAFSFMRTLPLAAVVASVVLLQVSDAFIQGTGGLTSGFSAIASRSIQLRPSLRSTSPHLSTKRTGLALSMTAIDRRSFLAAAGALFSAIDKNKDGSLDDKEIAAFAGAGGEAASPPGKKADDKLVKKLTEGLQNVRGAVPYSDQTLAVFTDDSAMSAAALVAAKVTGAKVVEIAASVSAEEAKELYKTSECVAALISTEARIKEVMAGAGLECARCGFFSDPAPPKWILALNSPAGKSGAKIQEDAKLSGRECDNTGLCYQSGTPIPVYTVEELPGIQAGKQRGGTEDDNNAR